ncbi:MAG: hypothetical protein Q8R57_13910 [Bacteroidota bacterium]|nr:hypothetical protein [Bacteroidota bacterium]
MSTISIETGIKISASTIQTELLLYNIAVKLYSLLYKLPSNIIRYLFKILLGAVFITLILPFLYFGIVFYLRRSKSIIEDFKKEIPSLSLSQLEEFNKIFTNLYVDKGINPDVLTNLDNNSPVLFRPIWYIIKESIDKQFELKSLIEEQIKKDLELFSQGLEDELPVGIYCEC